MELQMALDSKDSDIERLRSQLTTLSIHSLDTTSISSTGNELDTEPYPGITAPQTNTKTRYPKHTGVCTKNSATHLLFCIGLLNLLSLIVYIYFYPALYFLSIFYITLSVLILYFALNILDFFPLSLICLLDLCFQCVSNSFLF